MTRTPAKIESLRMLGADVVVSDVFDEVAVRDAVTEAHADVLITDLPDDVQAIAGFGAQSVAWKISGDGGAARRTLEALTTTASILTVTEN